MQSKMDILKVIKNAQDIDYPIPNSFRVNQILHYSGNSPYTHHTNVSEVERESSPQGYQWGTEFRSSCLHANHLRNLWSLNERRLRRMKNLQFQLSAKILTRMMLEICVGTYQHYLNTNRFFLFYLPVPNSCWDCPSPHLSHQ